MKRYKIIKSGVVPLGTLLCPGKHGKRYYQQGQMVPHGITVECIELHGDALVAAGLAESAALAGETPSSKPSTKGKPDA